jgi:hypothetical protein
MGEPAFEMPRDERPPVQPSEGESARRPELRAVTPEMSPAEAEGALMETADEMKNRAADDTGELTRGVEAQISDISTRYDASMTPQETAASAALGEKAKALEQTLGAEAAAVTGAGAARELSEVEAEFRSLDQQEGRPRARRETRCAACRG